MGNSVEIPVSSVEGKNERIPLIRAVVDEAFETRRDDVDVQRFRAFEERVRELDRLSERGVRVTALSAFAIEAVAEWVKEFGEMGRDKKRKGEVAELLFAARASALGLTVAHLWGESAKYDFLVGGVKRAYRVQVRSTTTLRKNGYPIRTCTHRRCIYTRKDIDFVAGYIFPEDTWYIVPAAAIRTQEIRVYPHAPHMGSYERFREKWELMK